MRHSDPVTKVSLKTCFFLGRTVTTHCLRSSDGSLERRCPYKKYHFILNGPLLLICHIYYIIKKAGNIGGRGIRNSDALM